MVLKRLYFFAFFEILLFAASPQKEESTSLYQSFGKPPIFQAR
jgi:hypothetical protein